MFNVADSAIVCGGILGRAARAARDRVRRQPRGRSDAPAPPRPAAPTPRRRRTGAAGPRPRHNGRVTSIPARRRPHRRRCPVPDGLEGQRVDQALVPALRAVPRPPRPTSPTPAASSSTAGSAARATGSTGGSWLEVELPPPPGEPAAAAAGRGHDRPVRRRRRRGRRQAGRRRRAPEPRLGRPDRHRRAGRGRLPDLHLAARPSGRASCTGWTPRPPGVMVVAKSERAYTALKAAFKERTVDKGYHALVQGHPDPVRAAPSTRRSTGTPSTTGGSPSSAAAARRSPTTRSWRRSRRPAWSTSSSRPGAPTRSGCTSPRCGTPASATLTYGADPTLAARLGVDPAVAARRPARLRRTRPTAAGWSSPASTRPTSPARWPSCAPRPEPRRAVSPTCRPLPAPRRLRPGGAGGGGRRRLPGRGRAVRRHVLHRRFEGRLRTDPARPAVLLPPAAGARVGAGRCSPWSSGRRPPASARPQVGLRWPQQWPGPLDRAGRRCWCWCFVLVSTRALRSGALAGAAAGGAAPDPARGGPARRAAGPRHPRRAARARRRSGACSRVVGVTAGVCEEWLYRGFFLAVVAALAGGPADRRAGPRGGGRLRPGARLPGAVGDRSRPACSAACWPALYLQTGSLLLPVLLHAAIDLRFLLVPAPARCPAAGRPR